MRAGGREAGVVTFRVAVERRDWRGSKRWRREGNVRGKEKKGAEGSDVG